MPSRLSVLAIVALSFALFLTEACSDSTPHGKAYHERIARIRQWQSDMRDAIVEKDASKLSVVYSRMCPRGKENCWIYSLLVV